MPLHVACPECGKKYRFADETLDVVACKECGASIGVSAKNARKSEKKKPKKPKAAPPAAGRLVEADRLDAIARGRTGARLMLLALFASTVGFALMFFNGIQTFRERTDMVVLPWLPPVLSIGSALLLFGATLHWLPIAPKIERGQVVQAALVLGPTILTMSVFDLFGMLPFALAALAAYLGWIYFTLLVSVIERVTILANRMDLKELADHVLTMGVGVVAFGLVGEFTAVLGFLPLAFMFYMLSRAIVLCMVYWIVNYTRLLVFTISLEDFR